LLSLAFEKKGKNLRGCGLGETRRQGRGILLMMCLFQKDREERSRSYERPASLKVPLRLNGRAEGGVINRAIAGAKARANLSKSGK